MVISSGNSITLFEKLFFVLHVGPRAGCGPLAYGYYEIPSTNDSFFSNIFMLGMHHHELGVSL